MLRICTCRRFRQVELRSALRLTTKPTVVNLSPHTQGARYETGSVTPARYSLTQAIQPDCAGAGDPPLRRTGQDLPLRESQIGEKLWRARGDCQGQGHDWQHLQRERIRISTQAELQKNLEDYRADAKSKTRQQLSTA